MHNKVSDYYDASANSPWYELLWHRDTYAVHFGFKDDKTKTLQDELLNTNKFLAEKAEIKNGERIFDAGCGIGGSSIWLAQNYKTNVVGANISTKQIEKAKKLALKRGVSEQTAFIVNDYLHTGLPSNSFDIVWSLESICYAPDKKDFLKEAYRLLKKGGRLILCDGFLQREPRDEDEKRTLQKLCQSYAVSDYPFVNYFQNAMKGAGFKNVQNWNQTQAVQHSLDIFCRIGYLTYPFARLGELIGLVPHILVINSFAGVHQKKIMNSGLFGYYVFVGQK